MANIEYKKVNIVIRKDQHVFCKECCVNISKLSRDGIDNLKEKLGSQVIQTRESPKHKNKGGKYI
jgi:hypothetical protein